MTACILVIALVFPMLPVGDGDFCKAAISKNLQPCAALRDRSAAATCLGLAGHTEQCAAVADLQSEQFCDAVGNADDAACQALDLGDARLICHALVSHNGAYCRDDGSSDAKTLCSAFTAQDGKQCKTIDDSGTRTFCQAYANHDPALCPAKHGRVKGAVR